MFAAVCLTFAVGCGGGTTEVIKEDVAAEDQKAADEQAQQYDSDEYAKSMAEQNKR